MYDNGFLSKLKNKWDKNLRVVVFLLLLLILLYEITKVDFNPNHCVQHGDSLLFTSSL